MVWSRQPSVLTPVIRHGLGAGLERAVVPAFRHKADLAGGAAVSYLATVVESPNAAGSLGLGMVFNQSLYNGELSVPSWTDVTGEASYCLVGHRDNTVNNAAWEMGASGSGDHFPFGNQGYCDVFWSSRWMSAVNAPSGMTFDMPSVLVFSVRNGSQRAHWNGRLWHTNTLTGGFTMPASLVLAKEGWVGKVFAAFAWSRALTDNEASRISINPWQLFTSPRGIRANAVAGATFNPAWARNSNVMIGAQG